MHPTFTASPGLPQVQAPTAFLPPLGKLSTTSSTQIFESLKALRGLYFSRTQPNPSITSLPLATKAALGLVSGSKEPLGIQKRFNAMTFRNVRGPITPSSTGYNTPVTDSGYASAYVSDNEGDEDFTEPANAASCCSLLCHLDLTDLETECRTLEALRADTFERTFATRWVTGFVSRAEVWVEEGNDNDAPEGEDDQEYTLRSALLEEALDILAAFTSVDQTEDGEEEEDPSYLRTLTFPCPQRDGEDEGTLTMQINDARINEDDHTSVGLQTWGSSIIFAERMCAMPSVYILPSLFPAPSIAKGKPLRILELGAGTGILSIVVEKLFQRGTYNPEVNREIVATDFHPEVLDNLRKNVEINFPSKQPIDVQTLDWQHPSTQPPFHEPFDLILAADVVYHPDHARWIKECAENLLSPDGIFWMFIALRASGRHEGLDETVDEIFGQPVQQGAQVVNAKGPKGLAVLETERLGRKSSSVGRADECAYRLFKIGWFG